MPNVLSRFAAETLGLRILPAECNEISHLWNPSCAWAIWDPFIPSWLFCLKTYGTLYTLKALADQKGRADRVKWKKVLFNTVRSSAFLTTTEILFMFWLCAFSYFLSILLVCYILNGEFVRTFRRMLGFATWPTISVLNGFAACAISIWIESKPRRGLIVPYLLNLATESLFRQAHFRKWIRRPVPKGESLLFGLSIALLVVLLAGPCGAKSDRSASFLRSVLGKVHGLTDTESSNPQNATSLDVGQRMPSSAVCDGNRKEGQTENEAKTHYNCAMKALKLSVKNFSLSMAGLTLLKLISNKKKKMAFNFSSFRPSAFLGALPLLYQFSHCLCSRLFRAQNTISRSFAAGLSSTFAMALFWPNNTLALYAFWKMIELLYFRLADARLVPVFQWADALLFCLVSSYLLGVAVLEPQALRPSYYKFLCLLTGNRLQQFNRPLFDNFLGTSSSNGLNVNSLPNIEQHLRTINPSFYLQTFHF